MSDILSRRNFISAAAAAPAILRAQGTNEKVQVGWIGVGIRGYSLIETLMKVLARTTRK